MTPFCCGHSKKISIHPPRAGRDFFRTHPWPRQPHFNPPSPCGEGRQSGSGSFSGVGISIHPPRAGRDFSLLNWWCRCFDFNPPSPCGEGLEILRYYDAYKVISIHPPRAGRDFCVNAVLFCYICLFQSTLPVRGGTWTSIYTDYNSPGFQSTLPVRGGTRIIRGVDKFTLISIHPPRAGRDGSPVGSLPGAADFNPPSPCGEGRKLQVVYNTAFGISIHPPRAGRDQRGCRGVAAAHRFQSTLPVRGGTRITPPPTSGVGISIHPPRAGRDVAFVSLGHEGEISIHPPRAGRDWTWYLSPVILRQFQSTLPVRGGTVRYWAMYIDGVFQSTLPVRGGTARHKCLRETRGISIHPPRAGRDAASQVGKTEFELFQSTLPVRGGTWSRCRDHSGL